MTTFIHHDGALGDVLLSLPSIRAIRAVHGPVHLAGRPDITRFLKQAKEVEDASSTDSRIYVSLYAGTPDVEVKNFLRQFDRAFIFTVRDDSPLVAALRGIIPDTRIVLTIPPEKAGTHVSDYRLGQGRHAIGNFTDPLSVPPIYKEETQALLEKAGHIDGKPLIALHPGSGGKRKCWPLERYFEFIERLQMEQEAFILLLTGPAEERSMRERIEAFCGERKHAVSVSEKELSAVAALLGECDLYVGNDSGVTHLAAAVGCPVVALFGPSDPALWRPRGRAVRVIAAKNGGDISSIPTQEVLSAIHEI